MASGVFRIKAVGLLRDEWFLGVSYLTTVLFLMFGDRLFAGLSNPLWLTAIFIWLFAVVLGSCLNVVRHADGIADVLANPTARSFSLFPSPPSKC